MKAKLDALLASIKATQEEFSGKPMPEGKAAEFETMCKDAKGIQDQLDLLAKATGMLEAEQKANRMVSSTMPASGQPAQKTQDTGPAGFISLGDFVAGSESFKSFRAAGSPKGQFPLAQVKGLLAMVTNRAGQKFVPLTADQVTEFKAVPTLGSGVIMPTQLTDLVRVVEHQKLSLRDVLDVSRTSSDAVQFMRLVSYTRAAAAVAHGVEKPESTLEMDSVTEAVRTIAVHIPVHNQQLSDLPALSGIINGELLYDISKHLEELVCYGNGSGQEFDGILHDTDVQSCRTEGGDTLIDIVRRGITDVRVAGYEANAVLVHPLDWEAIVLEKGSDNRYVWVVVTEGSTQRLWGVPVVETTAVEDFAGVTTEARNVLIGDFMRGATLWDREDANISVGWIDKQFTQNQRTILAELRAAFGVRRPGAFRKYESQAASAS